MVNCATNEGLAQESVWYEKSRYEDAERQMFEQMAKVCSLIVSSFMCVFFGCCHSLIMSTLF